MARNPVFAAGEAAGMAWIVQSGLVKLVAYDNSGREFLLDLVGPGEMIGSEACFGEAYTCTAVAVADSELCAIRCEHKTLTMQQLRYVAKTAQGQGRRSQRVRLTTKA